MGNGIYRLWISIIGQIGITVITIRLLLIFVTKSSQWITCFGLDYLIAVLISLYYSLTACIAIERTVAVYTHLLFNKMQSRNVAKTIIPILIVYHSLIAIHEFFQRRLLSDRHFSDHRWCSLYYNTPNRSIFIKFTNVFHLLFPYLINLITPILMFTRLTREKATINQNTTTWSNFITVLSTYKYNVISPSIIIILTTPRIILTFFLTCITYSWQNTMYLIVYFLSFVPLMTCLFIFVFPSSKFRKALRQFFQGAIRYRSVQQYT
ncbi:unnamed protein product [Rotaria sp. Silwood2]|nr:unnamed protein product [Rotaria sp. Silwood2]CAF3082094.1 unnamed protein product [Rotaria sp. Silwood2]CAF3297822.1 unnamed protein product [Rotaria sp. Silwood2]CAF3431717.1 unnamed protein product [Rotaria sp. Silwood2]CAF4277081.1 unnamed protein product [Rotaria sp. Silwood2]